MIHSIRVQGDGLSARRVIRGAVSRAGQSVQLRADGALHLRRLSGSAAPRGLAVGRVWRQSEIQHQVSQEVLGPETGQQGPACPD